MTWIPWLSLALSSVSTVLSAATLVLVWRRDPATVARALRHGTAAHELEQRGKVHELANRFVGLEERVVRIEALAMGSDGSPIGPHPASGHPTPPDQTTQEGKRP